VGLFVFVFASLLEISPVRGELPQLPDLPDVTGYPLALVLPAVVTSVLASMFAFSLLALRSGGFITGAYLALMLSRPLDVLFAVAVAVATWLVVSKLVMPRLLIFGRRKLSTMIMFGAILAWTAEIALRAATNDGYVPWRGLALMTMVIPALLANDAERQGIERTLWGAAITTLSVYGAMNVLAGVLRTAGVLPG
jgi:poly-gamma-glutamate biosynthesis protein PgsC/CapC